MFNFIKKLKGARNFVRLVNDPNKLNDVFQLSDNTDRDDALVRVAEDLAGSPKGAQAFETRHRLPKIDLQALARLPEGTLGRGFADHMLSRGLDPAAIPTLGAEDPSQYVRAHLYETHDIWHVVTGFDTDVAGELGLQGFYMAQFHGPLPPAILAAGLLNTSFHTYEESDVRMRNITVGWRMGKRAEPLFGTQWDQLWGTSLQDVRRMHGIDPNGARAGLEEEAAIANGFGGAQALERERVRALAKKGSKAPAPMLATARTG